MSRSVAIALVSAALAAGLHAQARETPEAFVARLRAAVAADNRRAVSAMFRVPMRVNAPGLPTPIAVDNTSAALQMYDLIFTPEMRCVLDLAQAPQAGQPAPKYPLLVSGDTVTIGGGMIVAERRGGTFTITGLTIAGPPAPRASRSGQPRAAAEIDLRFKGTVRQAAGTLAGDEVDRYTVSMTKGAVLQAKLERFKGLDAVLRVTDGKGRAVDAKADGKRAWTGLIPASGAYRVDVVRKAPSCDPALTYLLTLTTR